MTRKQQTFVREYLIDLNATQAAIRAGYSRKTGQQIGEENLRKPVIARFVENAIAKRAKRTEITADRVVLELARIAFFDVREAFTPEGGLRRLDEIDGDTAAAIIGIEVIETADAEDVSTALIKKVKLADKLGALQLLGRHLGLFNDKLALKGDRENPLTSLIKEIQGSALKPVAMLDLKAEEA